MLKATHLKNSAWSRQDGEFIVITKEGSEWIGTGESYQITSKTASGTQKELKKKGFTHIGWE